MSSDGVELQVMDRRFRAASNQRRHGFSGISRIQQNVIQCETRHLIKCFSNNFHVRFKVFSLSCYGSLSHYSEFQGFGRASGSFGIYSPKSEREVNCQSHLNRRSSPPVECTGGHYSGAASSYFS